MWSIHQDNIWKDKKKTRHSFVQKHFHKLTNTSNKTHTHHLGVIPHFMFLHLYFLCPVCLSEGDPVVTSNKVASIWNKMLEMNSTEQNNWKKNLSIQDSNILDQVRPGRNKESQVPRGKNHPFGLPTMLHLAYPALCCFPEILPAENTPGKMEPQQWAIYQ